MMIGRLDNFVGGFRSFSRSRSGKEGSVRKRAPSAPSGANPERAEGREVLKESFNSAVRDQDLDPRELERRQQEEKEFIRRNDTADSKVWLLVDVRWLQEWKQFVTRGGPLPGPVDNSALIDVQGRPRPGLRPVEDYRGVNAAVWAFWHQRYGGGPMIRRRQLDLYAAPVDEDPAERNASPPGDVAAAARGDSRSDSDSRSRQAAAPPRAGPRPRPSDRDRDESPSEASSSVRGSVVSSGSRGGTSGVSAAPPTRGSAALARGRTSDRNASQGPVGRGAPSASNRGQSTPALRSNAKAMGTPQKAAKPLCCDKCDGPHETDACPHFRKTREKHKDAWTMLGKGGSGWAKDNAAAAPILPSKSVRVVPQPGDGSCLFHSLSYGLSDRSSASSLRRDICAFIAKNPEEEIGDTTIKDWVNYDSGGTVSAYAQKMSSGTWGGGIEMAVSARMKNVNVHVYEKCREGYRRISAFESPGASKTVNVLYQGRMHYDAIVM